MGLLKLSTIVLLLVVMMPQIKTRSFPQGDVDMRGDEGVDLWADDNIAMERVKEEKGEKEEKKGKKEEEKEQKEEEDKEEEQEEEEDDEKDDEEDDKAVRGRKRERGRKG